MGIDGLLEEWYKKQKALVFNCVKMIEQDVFSLDDIYIYEAHLASLHPNNNNIKDHKLA